VQPARRPAPRLVRAQVTARQVNEAVDLLQARLRRRLEHLGDRLRARRRRAGAALFVEAHSGRDAVV
jgi:hypothetical protein